ncbi:amino acid racemase [Sorangium sp. So ce281]|uniref:aspartate/glutamate racemase family protein n=1 Tax=unclassified Sorangium TaxID=2621164 RepID=UPI003F5E5E47
MKPKQVAVPGILGGLGPLAHVELERDLIDEGTRRGARGDLDHPVWIVISATDVPDRTRSLQSRADECAAALVRYGNRLHAAGADFIVVPCHTAHAFYDVVHRELRVPWVHLVDHTAHHVARAHGGVRKVGVLATDGTLGSGIYQRSLRRLGLEAITPDIGSTVQNHVMQAIYDPGWGIKAVSSDLHQRARAVQLAAAASLVERGAEAVILACTELSVAMRGISSHAGVPLIDPLKVLASIMLDLAFGAPIASVDAPRPSRRDTSATSPPASAHPLIDPGV